MILSKNTIKAIRFDLLKFFTRIKIQNKADLKKYKNLHFGCGSRIIDNWLNVDIKNSQFDLDLSHTLPFENDYFEKAASQHVIEHLEIATELIPLLRELHRVLDKKGVLYLSCPDIKKICLSYLEDGGQGLYNDRLKRYPKYTLSDMPKSQMINELFQQKGEHKNLFDFELLKHILVEVGFTNIEEINEKIFLTENFGFPPRNDDFQTLYIKCQKM